MKAESNVQTVVRSFLLTAFVAMALIADSALAVDRIAISPAGDNELICDTDGKCSGSFCEDGSTPCTVGSDCKLFYCIGGSNNGAVCNPNNTLATECPGGTACKSPACLRVHNEDVVVCKPDSLGPLMTSCDWSLLFDGTDAGLAPKGGDPDASNERIKSLEFLDDGSLVIQFASTVNALPGLSTVKDKDLARCRPVREDDANMPDPYHFPITECAWSLFLNGEGVKAASDARTWDSVAVLQGEGSCRDVDGDSQIFPEECDVLLSLPGGSALGGVPVNDEDILRCIPTSLSGIAPGKTIESCEYAKFLDASEVNGPGGSGSWTGETFAFDVAAFDHETFEGLLYARISSQATNPPHQADRDIMELDGTFGPTGMCSISSDACISDSDCGGTCDSITTNPSGTMTIYLDGDGTGVDPEAGLMGVVIDAIAIIEDSDDDDVPDGADNCPNHVNPPSICSDGVTACTPGGGECDPGQACLQKDSDGDGVGDACDICTGRDDAVCTCGDGILDVPTSEALGNGLTNEECDLGELNGMPDTPCTIGCQTSGHCTGDPGMNCFEQSDCTGFGDCCGDGQTLGAEECDDANGIDDDECANDCTLNNIGIGEGIPVLGACEDIVGPNLVPAFVKKAKFNDRSKLGDKNNAGDIDKWKTKGDFNVVEGITIDPDTEPVTITFNNTTAGIIFEHTLPAGNFVQKVEKPTRNVWLFKDKSATTADSWRKGKFTEKANKIKFTLDGRTEGSVNPDLFEIDDIGSPVEMRQSIRVGDVCATVILQCVVNPTGKVLTCEPAP